jgi:integrase
VTKFLELWLEMMSSALKPATVNGYRNILIGQVAPVIGGIRLDKLTPGDMQRFYADRIAAGLSGTYVRQMHVVMHHALDDAVRWGLIHRNVVDAVDAPRKSTPEMTVWAERDVERFLVAAADDEYLPLWTLALTTGMRRGELLGLKWADINFEDKMLSVRRTLGRGVKGALVEGSPKTQSGQRRIALSPTLLALLQLHRERQDAYRASIEEAWVTNDYVFTNDIGGPLHPNSLARWFAIAMKRAGVPRIRFHDTRHTCATVLLTKGVHPKVVQELLGHSSIDMTLNRYSHVSRDMQQSAADAFETVLIRTNSGVS